MHGLIFATWEKFLGERYGEVVLGVYRGAVEGTSASIPLVTRVYEDEVLLKGITSVAEMTRIAPNVLLREYGRFFISNVFTGHVCSHILQQVQCARDLLLIMRAAHRQLHHASEEIVPPLFKYEPLTGSGIRIMYDSHRHLCPILWGAIEGAGMRYGEEIAIQELSCMQKGDEDCQFDVNFLGKCEISPHSPDVRSIKQTKAAEDIFHMLPLEGRGLTLCEISNLLRVRGNDIRPSQVAGIMRQLQNVGLVILSAKQEGDLFYEREYLRVSKIESEAGRLLVVTVY